MRWAGIIVGALFLILASCRSGASPAPGKTQIRMAGAKSALDVLLKIYDNKIPRVAFSTIATQGAAANVDYIQRGLAEVGFTQADIAYFAMTQGTPLNPVPHTKLRSIASTASAAFRSELYSTRTC